MNCCLALSIDWLVCGRAIDDYVQWLQRRAKAANLNLVQVPCRRVRGHSLCLGGEVFGSSVCLPAHAHANSAYPPLVFWCESLSLSLSLPLSLPLFSWLWGSRLCTWRQDVKTFGHFDTFVSFPFQSAMEMHVVLRTLVSDRFQFFSEMLKQPPATPPSQYWLTHVTGAAIIQVDPRELAW